MARICIIRQHYFPLEPRLRREVEALVAVGHQVDVVCLARPDEARNEQMGNITVRRIPLQRRRGSPVRYLMEYGSFLVIAGLLVSVLSMRRRYDLVQANTIPDALVFAAFVPRLLGARVLLDLYECMPEFFATKFQKHMGHPGVRLVAWLEQASIRFADYAITCNEQMHETFVARGTPRDKLGIIMNSADREVFDPQRYPTPPRTSDRFVLICHGSIEERYGLDTAIRAVGLLRGEMPGLRLEIYGEGSDRERLVQLTRDLHLEHAVSFSDGFVPMEDLLKAIAAADAGVVATKRDLFRDLVHCLKMFDYIEMRKPVIVSRTPAVEAYFDESCFQYFDSDNPMDLARAIRELHANPELAKRRVQHATRVNEPYRWSRQAEFYREIVERVLTNKQGRMIVPAPVGMAAGHGS